MKTELEKAVEAIENAKRVFDVYYDESMPKNLKVQTLQDLSTETREAAKDNVVKVGTDLVVGEAGAEILESIFGRNPVVESLSTLKQAVDVVGATSVVVNAAASVAATVAAVDVKTDGKISSGVKSIGKGTFKLLKKGVSAVISLR